MSRTDEEGNKLPITEAQKQGLKIANMAVEDWAAELSMEVTIRVHRVDKDDPARFNQVIKELPFLGHFMVLSDVSTSSVESVLNRLISDLQYEVTEGDDGTGANLKELCSYVKAALAGKEAP